MGLYICQKPKNQIKSLLVYLKHILRSDIKWHTKKYLFQFSAQSHDGLNSLLGFFFFLMLWQLPPFTIYKG
ncbi:hypothetical protein EUGRSUZ_H01787 [Eucalyptus grandis]|uniref:Uncharacterized protein n=2 Tax=Eucalyptus grandis TaxID=71139 RepID=A0ACC3JQW0_EUCGR|nr:hypothetical protein EUGRSUZ_H01787 [Eucalyptus grandis]